MRRTPFDIAYDGRIFLGLTRQLAPETEILIIPEDVHLIMEATEVIQADETTLRDALSALEDYQPRPLGSVVIRQPGAGPLILAAVVYDFSQEPIARPADVFEALVNAFETARRHQARMIAVRPLGTRPPAMTPSEFWSALTQVCRTTAELGTSIERVDLLIDTEQEYCFYDDRFRSSAPQ